MAKPQKLDIKVGDIALIGRAGISHPADWLTARVILVCDDEVATEHTPGGQSRPQRQFFGMDEVRAYGVDHLALDRFRHAACKTMKAEKDAIEAAGRALEGARKASWARLDEIGAAVPARIVNTTSEHA